MDEYIEENEMQTNSEQMETEDLLQNEVDYTEILQQIKSELETQNFNAEVLHADLVRVENEVQFIGHDVRIIMTFVILSFCWSCMRAWRKNVTKGA